MSNDWSILHDGTVAAIGPWIFTGWQL